MGKRKKSPTETEPDQPPPEKTKRTDVAERKESNKDTDFTCVKMSFNSLVENNYFRGGLQDIVLNINKICFLSYQLLNYHFTRLLAENKPITDISQSLFYQACSTVSVMIDRNEKIDITDELYISFSHYKDKIGELPFRNRMGNLLNNLCRQQVTMTVNHLKLNFYKRFHKYLELKTGETRKGVIYQWLKDIYAVEYKGKNFFIHSMRQWLKYTPTDKTYKNILPTLSKYTTKSYKHLKNTPTKKA